MAKNLLLWLVVALVLMSVFQNIVPDTASDSKSNYTQFIQDVQNGAIREVKINDRRISGVKRSGEQFETIIPTPYDPDLLNDLIKNNVRVVGVPPEEPSMLASILISWFPMLLLIGVWIFFMRQMQGGGGKGAMSFGKSKHQ